MRACRFIFFYGQTMLTNTRAKPDAETRTASALSRRTALLLAASLAGSIAFSSAAWAQAAPRVKLTTSAGDIVVELDQAKAPKTVDNFLQYVKDKHYDGTVFHRVIDGFMIQGGGFTANMQQKPTRPPIALEASNG